MPLPPAVRQQVVRIGQSFGVESVPAEVRGWMMSSSADAHTDATAARRMGLGRAATVLFQVGLAAGYMLFLCLVSLLSSSAWSGSLCNLDPYLARSISLTHTLPLSRARSLRHAQAASLVRGHFGDVNSTYRMGWLPMGTTLMLGPMLIAGLWLLIGNEYGSVWCWSYGARFSTGFCTRGCYWIARLFA
jgi:hypothetical protein